MVKQSRGKVRKGSHTTLIAGLVQYIEEFDEWDEVSLICIGPKAQYPKRKRRRVNNVMQAPATRRTRRGGGGGRRFRAVRREQRGQRAVGIFCWAEYGTMRQKVTLMGPDLDRLETRLKKANLWGD